MYIPVHRKRGRYFSFGVHNHGEVIRSFHLRDYTFAGLFDGDDGKFTADAGISIEKGVQSFAAFQIVGEGLEGLCHA
jgi:hypothetical protein